MRNLKWTGVAAAVLIAWGGLLPAARAARPYDPRPLMKKLEKKNGKNATTGTCPECSTKMFKIGKATPAA